jgi:hypothetical protein
MSNEVVKSINTSIEKVGDLFLIDEYLLGKKKTNLDKTSDQIILSNRNLIPFRKKNKWGYSTENRNLVIECDFDYAQPFLNEIAFVRKKDKIIFINQEGKILFQRSFNNEYYFFDTVNPFIWFQRYDDNYTQGIFDRKGNELISKSIRIQFNDVDDRLVVFKDDNNDDKKFGFFCVKNSKLVDCKYNKIKSYKNGFFSVGKTIYNNKYMYGFIDINDEMHITYKYSDVHEFSCDLAGVKIGTKWGYINSKEELVIPAIYRQVRNFKNNLAVVYLSKNKWGLIDHNGNVILPTKFDYVSVHNDNLFGIKKDGVCGFINRDGEFINNKVYNDISYFQNGFASVMIKNKWGSIDLEGKQTIPPKYGTSFRFNEYGFATVVIDPCNWTQDIIDQKGNSKIPPNSESATIWGNRFILKIDNKYGCLDENGNEIIPFIWDQIEIHDDNLVKGYFDSYFYGYINRNGVQYWDD